MRLKSMLPFLFLAWLSGCELISCSENDPIPEVGPNMMTDVDNHVYSTVRIGQQVWMAENLRVTRYRNGDVIGSTASPLQDIRGEDAPKYTWIYEGNGDNLPIYGRLYTWHALTDPRGVCPVGWHLPTASEWETLIAFIGGVEQGISLKDATTTYWNGGPMGTDVFGFRALPSGYRLNDTGDPEFYGLRRSAHWWSATENAPTSGRTVQSVVAFEHDGSAIFARSLPAQAYAFACRCVQD